MRTTFDPHVKTPAAAIDAHAQRWAAEFTAALEHARNNVHFSPERFLDFTWERGVLAYLTPEDAALRDTLRKRCDGLPWQDRRKESDYLFWRVFCASHAELAAGTDGGDAGTRPERRDLRFVVTTAVAAVETGPPIADGPLDALLFRSFIERTGRSVPGPKVEGAAPCHRPGDLVRFSTTPVIVDRLGFDGRIDVSRETQPLETGWHLDAWQNMKTGRWTVRAWPWQLSK